MGGVERRPRTGSFWELSGGGGWTFCSQAKEGVFGPVVIQLVEACGHRASKLLSLKQGFFPGQFPCSRFLGRRRLRVLNLNQALRKLVLNMFCLGAASCRVQLGEQKDVQIDREWGRERWPSGESGLCLPMAGLCS